VILVQSVIIIISFLLVSLIEFGDADAQEQNVTNTSALMEKGIALYDLGQYNESIGRYDKVLAIDPNHVDALNAKGAALYDLGKYNESIGYFDKTLGISHKYFALDTKRSNLPG
jgi:tetratricopeptide (TPR) repeat protein